MKKSLFLVLIVGVCSSLQAQNSAPAFTKVITVTPMQLAQMRQHSRQAAEKSSQSSGNQSKTSHNMSSVEPHLPFLGSSANVNGVLDATTTAVTANQACNLLVMTHRDNASNIPSCGTGAYIAAYSTNGGSVWDTTYTIFCNPATGPGVRYPNGVIFNPNNGTATPNTNPANAIDVMSGPYTNGSEWVSTVYGSITFGGDPHNQTTLTNGNAGVQTQDNGDLSFMSSSDDSTVHVMGEGFVTNAAQTVFYSWLGGVLTTGKFHGGSADSFVWTQKVFLPHIVPSYKGFAYSMAKFDSDAAPLTVPGTAWSQDGKTGYVVFMANADSSGYNYGSDQPIVYKTTNSGQTWTMMPLYNFSGLASLTQHLEASSDNPAVKLPLWFDFETEASQGCTDDYDLTVDYMGNLHIFGAVVGSYYSNVDSSYRVSWFSNEDGYIYDVSTNGASWQARLIDSMMTLPIGNVARGSVNTDWDSSGSAGFVGFGNRLQCSRTTNGKYVFCTWVDDVTGNIPNSLAFPDVFGQAYNIATATAGSVYQFTSTTNNYFLCASDIAVTNTVAPSGDTVFTVPCTIAFPQQLPDDGTLPINYFYLGKVQYDHTLSKTTGSNFSSVPTVSAQEFSIGPNYPNPFNNTTQFNVSLSNENLVAVDVYNLVGQKVYSIPAQQMSAGNHLMTINGSGFSAGVYFYKVTVGDQSKTQKMVVQ